MPGIEPVLCGGAIRQHRFRRALDVFGEEGAGEGHNLAQTGAIRDVWSARRQSRDHTR